MSSRQVARLAFVMAGIYGLFQVVQQIGGIAWLLWPQSGEVFAAYRRMGITFLVAEAMATAGASALIFFSPRLARWIFPEGESEPSERVYLAMPMVAYSVVGVLCCVWGLADAGRAISSTLVSGRGSASVSSLVRAIILLTVGIGLFFGSHGLARFWSRLRYSGLRRKLGLCIRCGYDLRGTTSDRCPECGVLQTPLPTDGQAAPPAC